MFDSLRQAYSFLSRGGPVMVPITMASVFCFALIVERFYYLRRSKILPTKLVDQLDELLREEKISEALALCRATEAPIGRVLSGGLSKLDQPKAEVSEALEGSGKREARLLENRLEFLAILAAVSPLLGLLGTITGMINTFIVVRISGLGDPMKLSGGIAEALICTAAGLVVAIPAVVFHRYFLHKVDQFVIEMEEMAEKVLSLAGK